MGERQPVPNKDCGRGKDVTLFISAIVLMLNDAEDRETLLEFLEHWETVTGSSVEKVLRDHLRMAAPDKRPTNERYLPKEYFEGARTCGLPYLPTKTSTGFLREKFRDAWVTLINRRGTTPERGDVLWLLNRFFHEMYPGNHLQKNVLILIPGFMQTDSVYNKLVQFCARPTYRHHPHWLTLLAVAHMAEMGKYETSMPATYVSLAARLLRDGYAVENMKKKGTINGHAFDLGYKAVTIGRAKNIEDIEDDDWKLDIEGEDEGAPDDDEDALDDDDDAPDDNQPDDDGDMSDHDEDPTGLLGFLGKFKGKGKAPDRGGNKRKFEIEDVHRGDEDDSDEMLLDMDHGSMTERNIAVPRAPGPAPSVAAGHARKGESSKTGSLAKVDDSAVYDIPKDDDESAHQPPKRRKKESTRADKDDKSTRRRSSRLNKTTE